MSGYALVVTTIAAPNDVLRSLAAGAATAGWRFIAIGDRKSPEAFALPGCEYYSLADQRATGLRLAEACPVGHYARKNIGYLLAMRSGAEWIVETDDDNVPRAEFFAARNRHHETAGSQRAGWVNAYRWFSEALMWPRGFPLGRVRSAQAEVAELPRAVRDCPIQQGLADENPDLDAVYRLTLPLPQSFAGDVRVAIGEGSWCPFNSQNTGWQRDAFALMYLPAHCSFRMTDIWRSFVAQRIAWTNGWSVLFHEPTVRQERNEHDLMRDFRDEIPGYLHNEGIAAALAALPLAAGAEHVADNLRSCYEELVRMDLIGAAEPALLEVWLRDLADVLR